MLAGVGLCRIVDRTKQSHLIANLDLLCLLACCKKSCLGLRALKQSAQNVKEKKRLVLADKKYKSAELVGWELCNLEFSKPKEVDLLLKFGSDLLMYGYK